MKTTSVLAKAKKAVTTVTKAVKTAATTIKKAAATVANTIATGIKNLATAIKTQQSENKSNSGTAKATSKIKQAVNSEKRSNTDGGKVISTIRNIAIACAKSLREKNADQDAEIKKPTVWNAISNVIMPSAKAEDAATAMSVTETWINAFTPYMMDIQNLDGPMPVGDAAALAGLAVITVAGLTVDGVKRLIESFPTSEENGSHIEVYPQQMQPPMTESIPSVKVPSMDEGIDIVPQPGPAPEVFPEVTPSPSIVFSDGNINSQTVKQTTPNQMRKQIERGQAPKEVERVDSGDTSVGSQPHIHFGDNDQSLNRDGTWGHEGGKKQPKLNNEVIKWLAQNGWGIPEGY